MVTQPYEIRDDGGERVYLREIDGGTPNACWVVCSREDSGATPFIPEPFWYDESL